MSWAQHEHCDGHYKHSVIRPILLIHAVWNRDDKPSTDDNKKLLCHRIRARFDYGIDPIHERTILLRNRF